MARAILAFSLTTTPEELDTARYCRARAKIPALVLQQLSRQVAQPLEDAAPADWRWHGRRVHLANSSTCRLPDTPVNQAAFPQPAQQKPGLDIPLLRAGCRVRELSVATTLQEAAEYPASAVGEGCHKRWHVELDIRSLKVTLGMDQLRCQTPALIEREIWAHVLAYNLVRKVAAQAAVLAQVSPRVIRRA